MTEIQLYSEAARLALIALGKSNGRRGAKPRWHAEDDPLAHWELTESIVALTRVSDHG